MDKKHKKLIRELVLLVILLNIFAAPALASEIIPGIEEDPFYQEYKAKSLLSILFPFIEQKDYFAVEEPFADKASDYLENLLIMESIMLAIILLNLIYLIFRHDKRLKKYYDKTIKEKNAKISHINRHLIKHGLDEEYISKFSDRHEEILLSQKLSLMLIIVIGITFMGSFGINDYIIDHTYSRDMAGMAVMPGQGCCERFCKVTLPGQCYEGEFHLGSSCDDLESCNIGCCIDPEGYCLSNYLRSNCEMFDYSFIRKECSELTQCVMPVPPLTVREDTGIHPNADKAVRLYYDIASGITFDGSNVIFTEGDPYGIRYMLVDPITGYHGTTFKIKYIISQFTDIDKVEIALRDNESLITNLALFDDGLHEDANKNDGIFGNVWDSSSFHFDGKMRMISVDSRISNKDSSLMPETDIFNFAVSRSRCLPLIGWTGDTERVDIMFLGNTYTDLEQLRLDVGTNFNNFAIITPFRENFNNITYYFIEKEFDFTSANQVPDAIRQECGFFDQDEDLAVIFDYNEDQCRKVSDGIFTLSPETIYYFDSPYIMQQAVDNLCLIVQTMEEYSNERTTAAMDIMPSIDIQLEEGPTFWKKQVEIPFIINDITQDEVEYEFSIIGAETFREKGPSGQRITKNLELPDGEYKITITSENALGLPAFTEVDIIVKDINYNIQVLDPQEGDEMTGSQMEVNFIVTNNNVSNVDYEIFIDDVEKDHGTVPVEEQKTATIYDLEEGDHKLLIYATDRENRRISSDKIIFRIIPEE